MSMLADFWILMVERGWALALLRGSAVTIAIGLLGMLLGFVVATPLAILRWQKVMVVSQMVDAYSILIRGIPGLLVIYLLFYGSLGWVRTIAGTFGYEQVAENAYP